MFFYFPKIKLIFINEILFKVLNFLNALIVCYKTIKPNSLDSPIGWFTPIETRAKEIYRILIENPL